MFYQKLACILFICLQNFTAFSTRVNIKIHFKSNRKNDETFKTIVKHTDDTFNNSHLLVMIDYGATNNNGLSFFW